MFRVGTTLLAGRQLTRVPGLYEHVRRVLIGMLETAEPFRVLQQGYLPLDSPMSFAVGDYVIWYSLEAENRSATILAVEPAGAERGSSNDPEQAAS
jgi:hypothetical protein